MSILSATDWSQRSRWEKCIYLFFWNDFLIETGLMFLKLNDARRIW